MTLFYSLQKQERCLRQLNEAGIAISILSLPWGDTRQWVNFDFPLSPTVREAAKYILGSQGQKAFKQIFVILIPVASAEN